MKDEPNTSNRVPQMTTINETAKLANVSVHFVRQLAIQNRVVHVKTGRKYLINFDRFIDYLNSGYEAKEAEPEPIQKGRIRRLT